MAKDREDVETSEPTFSIFDVTIGCDEKGGSPLLMNRLAPPKKQSEKDEDKSKDPIDVDEGKKGKKKKKKGKAAGKNEGALFGNPEEWRDRLYFEEGIGVHIPMFNLLAMFRDNVVKETIQGVRAKSVFASGTNYVDPELIAKKGLQYAMVGVPLKVGRKLQSLETIAAFQKACSEMNSDVQVWSKFARNAGQNAAPQMRYRPRFDFWQLHFVIVFDEVECTLSRMHNWVVRAGHRQGLCDGRPSAKKPWLFGKFRLMDIKALEDVPW